ncbi:endo alpha-1,4 polygalactosaminidase [Micromonospora yasonensis]|uniref:endo alpha-1,4 polygalactosaminidase n=1 Tax=Micromonospora yasonensis TaxID=1128667 RepID=UPI0022323EE3|nr:endo alpha-1,4 polygalactosaminidase [Micromonospora yasonensis]MCW3840646.1 endo alpha-1,4 polygalactosaminidase [Micromonospora yasonensis]
MRSRHPAQFPAAVLGRTNGWPGEKWLDIREIQNANSVLRSSMDGRLDMCKQKGFDMVELDNVDGYLNKTGFPLTAADQLYYNAVLANDSHARGLSVLQKNDNEQIPALLPYFDGALNEQCNQYKECTTAQNGSFGLDQYIAAGKPVFQAEYKLTTSSFCAADNAANFNGVRFALNLDDTLSNPAGSSGWADDRRAGDTLCPGPPARPGRAASARRCTARGAHFRWSRPAVTAWAGRRRASSGRPAPR